ncbi:MAG: hypothetical protein ACI8W9_002095, partial [Psychromonas sp.]
KRSHTGGAYVCLATFMLVQTICEERLNLSM